MHSRKNIWSATKSEMTTVGPYGRLLVDFQVLADDGSWITAAAVNPQELIDRGVRRNGSFAEMLSARLDAQPPVPERPWRIILYADEVVPGNPLAHAHRTPRQNSCFKSYSMLYVYEYTDAVSIKAYLRTICQCPCLRLLCL